MAKLFVWDFHGVLEKDNEHAVMEISNKVLKNLGYKEQISKELNQKLYGQKWYEYFEYLLPGESHAVHIKIQQACIAYEQKHPEIVGNSIKPNDHAHQVLDAIRASIHDQILISNMSDVALDMFMNSIKITKYFKNRAFSCNTHSGKKTYTKHERLKSYLDSKNFEELVIIGDTPNDISLQNVAGGITYLYAHSHLSFPECKPRYRISDLREVLREV